MKKILKRAWPWLLTLLILFGGFSVIATYNEAQIPKQNRAYHIARTVSVQKCVDLGYVGYEWRPCAQYTLCFFCYSAKGELFPASEPVCGKVDRSAGFGEFLERCGHLDPLLKEKGPPP